MVSVVSHSFALLGMIGIIGLLVALVKAISDWEYGIARALVIIVGLPIVVLIIAVIYPSMMSKAMGLALLALILLIGAMLGIALWVLKSLDVLS